MFFQCVSWTWYFELAFILIICKVRIFHTHNCKDKTAYWLQIIMYRYYLIFSCFADSDVRFTCFLKLVFAITSTQIIDKSSICTQEVALPWRYDADMGSVLATHFGVIRKQFGLVWFCIRYLLQIVSVREATQPSCIPAESILTWKQV